VTCAFGVRDVCCQCVVLVQLEDALAGVIPNATIQRQWLAGSHAMGVAHRVTFIFPVGDVPPLAFDTTALTGPAPVTITSAVVQEGSLDMFLNPIPSDLFQVAFVRAIPRVDDVPVTCATRCADDRGASSRPGLEQRHPGVVWCQRHCPRRGVLVPVFQQQRASDCSVADRSHTSNPIWWRRPHGDRKQPVLVVDV
jgi:hypothetical protein